MHHFLKIGLQFDIHDIITNPSFFKDRITIQLAQYLKSTLPDTSNRDYQALTRNSFCSGIKLVE